MHKFKIPYYLNLPDRNQSYTTSGIQIYSFQRGTLQFLNSLMICMCLERKTNYQFRYNINFTHPLIKGIWRFDENKHLSLMAMFKNIIARSQSRHI